MNEMFGIGSVLATGFRVWIKNFVPFVLITALIYLPFLIWGASTVQGEIDLEKIQRIARFEQFMAIALILAGILVAAALTYGTVMELQGQRASVGACIAIGLGRFFPALGVGLLATLCVFGAALCLLIPAFIVMPMLYVSTQAAVLERPGVMGALRRSRELTRGHRFQIFVLIILLGILGVASNKVMQMVIVPNMADPGHFEDTLSRIPLLMYANLARVVLLSSLSAVMASVAYYLLRVEKDGTSAAELARVFD